MFATVLALASAALHASWNLFIKTSDDSDLASIGQFMFGGLLAVPVVAVMGWPPAAAAPSLVASSLVHVLYVLALVRAYNSGDFSLAYPLARGGGALLAAIGGVLLLDDRLGFWAWVAACIVAVGLASLVDRHVDRTSMMWAAATAVAICVYTLIDSRGSRLSTSGAPYGIALMIPTAAAVVAAGGARGRLRPLAASLRTQWWRYLIAGALLDAAYTLVLIAVKHAPVGQVTMLRESSVVLGAAAGWLFLKEPLGGRRLRSSIIICVGLVLLVVASGS